MVSHKYKQLSHDITLAWYIVCLLYEDLKHHRLLRLENRGFLDSFNPSMREKNVYVIIFYMPETDDKHALSITCLPISNIFCQYIHLSQIWLSLALKM